MSACASTTARISATTTAGLAASTWGWASRPAIFRSASGRAFQQVFVQLHYPTHILLSVSRRRRWGARGGEQLANRVPERGLVGPGNQLHARRPHAVIARDHRRAQV